MEKKRGEFCFKTRKKEQYWCLVFFLYQSWPITVSINTILKFQTYKYISSCLENICREKISINIYTITKI